MQIHHGIGKINMVKNSNEILDNMSKDELISRVIELQEMLNNLQKISAQSVIQSNYTIRDLQGKIKVLENTMPLFRI